jgi:predicted dehydrogenase
VGQRPLRAAIVGLQHPHVGRLDRANPTGYIYTFTHLHGVRVVAYVDPDPTLRQQVRAVDPRAGVYASADHLVAEQEFDIACVALPASEVPATGVTLAEAGKHFYLEKQFARTSADLVPLVRAVRRAQVKVLAGYPWRTHPIARELKRLIAAGTLGAPLSIESRLVTTQVRPGSPRDPKHLLYRRDTEGGGILHMLGGHWLELMRFLMGCEVKAVQAMIGRPLGYIEEPLEDVAIAAFEYENGAYGSIHAGYLQAPLPGPYDSCLVYRGSEGWATWAPVGAPRLEVKSTATSWSSAPERAFEYALEPYPGYGGARWHFEFLQGFIGDIQANREPAVTVEDALHVLQLIDAAYESARTGRRVEVRYGPGAAG